MVRAAEALIAAELTSEAQTTLHPSIPAAGEVGFSALIQGELERVAAGAAMTGGVDLSRYDMGESPPLANGSNSSNGNDNNGAEVALLTAAHHLSTRFMNLNLLNRFGKNAWLVHNDQLEAQLRACEVELAELKVQCDIVNKERKAAQEQARPEMHRLQARWGDAVGTVLQTEVAAEHIRLQILGLRRQIANNNNPTTTTTTTTTITTTTVDAA